jgi:F-type H+-transporting ATPase subunit delta
LREPTIARNYAEALFAAGERVEETARFADLLDALAGAIEADDQIRMALESPRVPKAIKSDILRRALSTYAPETFLLFIVAVVRRGRQGMFPQISRQYQALVDIKFNRVHAGIALAREPDVALKEEIRRKLSEILDSEVVPHFRYDRAILGGLIVRVGDRVMDGSLRRKLVRLRRQMLGV